MKTGLLRCADAQELAQMRADLAYCPVPLAGRDLMEVMVALESSGSQSGIAPDELFPLARPLTRTDRLLLCGGLGQLRLRAVAAHALSNKIDVWVLESPKASIALALIETLGITLCDWQPQPADGAGIVCVGAAGESLQSACTGWLVSSERLSDSPVGFMDGQGWIHVLGTTANSFHADEYLLAPFEGIARLETHPRVTGVCLLAIQEERAERLGMPVGFFACAEITGEASPVLEVELLAFVRRGLSARKCPLGIMLVDVLPRTRSGAPDLTAAWALVEEQASSAAGLPASTGP